MPNKKNKSGKANVVKGAAVLAAGAATVAAAVALSNKGNRKKAGNAVKSLADKAIKLKNSAVKVADKVKSEKTVTKTTKKKSTVKKRG